MPAAASGTYSIGGDLPVNRIGYGTMQLTGTGHWDSPAEANKVRQLLRDAVDLGCNDIDTADAYGPTTTEHLIRTALHPYPDELVIAAKGGMAS
ncbi:aldo/keto reductase [Nocardia sp. NPDC052278]|uniref:aldo/keto reductase n=1 Tax=unclassified Nocardia TaxID=2637762 RepID=UPI00368D666D